MKPECRVSKFCIVSGETDENNFKRIDRFQFQKRSVFLSQFSIHEAPQSDAILRACFLAKYAD